VCILFLLSDNGENFILETRTTFYIRKNGNLRFIAKRDATGKQIFHGNVKGTSTVCSVNLENNLLKSKSSSRGRKWTVSNDRK
jgi:hypothetical protein